jgi:basic membrane protein A
VAPQYPNVKFVIVNGQLSEAPNLHVFFIREGLPAYIAGVIATKLTKTKKVGFVGGALIPPTTQQADAFKAGVEATDPSVTVQSVNTGDFNNATLAKQATATQVSQGADVIFLKFNNAWPGTQQAIQESGKDVKVFATIVPRCEEKNVIGSATLNLARFEENIVKEFIDGKLPAGEVRPYGIEDPSVQAFELCPPWKDQQELSSLVSDLTGKINAGQVQMPKGV